MWQSLSRSVLHVELKECWNSVCVLTDGEGRRESLSMVHGVGRCSLDGKLDKLLDIFCAATAAAALFEAKF